MKNELTAEEWIALNNYLQFGIVAFKYSEDFENFRSAKNKIKYVAKEIESRGKK